MGRGGKEGHKRRFHNADTSIFINVDLREIHDLQC